MLLVVIAASVASAQKMYPPHTEWYQDPLGLRPVELSSAPGFAWGAAAVAACLLLTKNDSSFRKRIYLYEEAGVGGGYKPPYTLVIQNNAGVLYKVRQWMAVGAAFNAFYLTDGVNNTLATGVRPFARWYAWRQKRFHLFFEYGAGVSYSIDRFPLTGTGYEADTARTGTHFNYTPTYCIGTEIKITGNMMIQAGVRHTHLSNGNIKGIDRNPSHDSNGFFAGVLYCIW
jgi:opacity protein-like surface antigen